MEAAILLAVDDLIVLTSRFSIMIQICRESNSYKVAIRRISAWVRGSGSGSSFTAQRVQSRAGKYH